MTTTLVSLLEARFTDRRDEPAVICGAERMTYGELDHATATRAAWLDHHGVPPRATLGLTLDRGLAQVAWIVAIVRSGRALCFLDRAHPAAWNRDVMARAELRHVIGQPLATMEDAATWIDADPPITLAGPAIARPITRPDDRVYVNFSSGTTGAPKVIPCLHRGVVAFCHAPAHLPVDARTRCVYSSPLTFDASQLELWLPLANGGCVVVNERQHLTLDGLRSLIAEAGANTLWLTSSLFNAFVDIDPGSLSGIRTLIIGGEALSPGHVAALQAARPEIAVFNGYGPTETTIIACVYPIPRNLRPDQPVPIGWPIAGTELFVVAADGQPCRDDQVGELWIAGDGVTPGYLGDRALSEAKYVTRSVNGTNVRCYRSGDLVSRDARGLVRFHGRIDDQIKIRGHRVVLSEVELAYAAHPRIRSCVALTRKQPERTSLVVFYVADGSSPGAPALDASDLAAFARDRLPTFMQAQELVCVAELPLRANGKVDRDRLLATPGEGATRGRDDDPRAALLRQLTGLPGWRSAASFFESGGDSLGAIRLVGMLDRVAAGALRLEDLYHAPRLCDVLARLPADLVLPVPDRPLASGDVRGAVPLTPAQLTMLYPELIHGDTTRNGVVYLFARDFGDAIVLDDIEATLRHKFPLVAAIVIEDDTGYAFSPGPGPDLVPDRAVRKLASVAACARHWLDEPLPLATGPLLRLFRTEIAGRRHHGIVLHHILGDHVGQLELLRATEALLATGGRAELGPPDTAYVTTNPRIVARCEAERDACVDAWQRKQLVGEAGPRPQLTGPQAKPAAASPVVRQHRLRAAYPDRAPSQLLLACLAAAKAGFEAGFGVREPVIFALFSLRDAPAGLGFQTVLAPIALRDALFPAGRPGPALLDELLATRRHAVIGMEDALVAAGLAQHDVPFLFNFVDMPPDDHRWIAEHLVDAGAERARTLLDVTVLRAGTLLDVTLNGTCDAAQAAAFTRAFDAVVLDHAG